MIGRKRKARSRDYVWFQSQLGDAIRAQAGRSVTLGDVIHFVDGGFASQLTDEAIVLAIDHLERIGQDHEIRNARARLIAEQGRRQGELQHRTLVVATWALAVSVITLLATVAVPLLD